MPANPEQKAIARRIRKEVPLLPGVYIFRDRDGNVIYIGKSKTLRNRMLSHLRIPRKKDTHRLPLHLEIRHFEIRLTLTELHALLLEDLLIKKHRPLFNKRQNEFREQCWLELGADDYPALRVVAAPRESASNNLFGPFRDTYQAEALIAVAQDYYGLRSCPPFGALKGCIRSEIGSCAGPCRESTTTANYAVVVTRTTAFLQGSLAQLSETIGAEMKRCAAEERFEEAARHREVLAFCERFCERQAFLHRFRSGNIELVPNDDTEYRFQFRQGHLDSPPPAWPPERDILADPRCLSDRGNIIYNWLRANTKTYSCPLLQNHTTDVDC